MQYSTVDGPLTASKDLEIKSLKEEIEKLRKQVAGDVLRFIINLVDFKKWFYSMLTCLLSLVDVMCYELYGIEEKANKS